MRMIKYKLPLILAINILSVYLSLKLHMNIAQTSATYWSLFIYIKMSDFPTLF